MVVCVLSFIVLNILGTYFLGSATSSTIRTGFVSMRFAIDLVTPVSGSLYSRLSVGGMCCLLHSWNSYILILVAFVVECLFLLCCICCLDQALQLFQGLGDFFSPIVSFDPVTNVIDWQGQPFKITCFNYLDLCSLDWKNTCYMHQFYAYRSHGF